MYARPIDQWCLELLDNALTVSQFHWDAERHYKYDGVRWVHFIDEPWTADEWWEVQVLYYFSILVSKPCMLIPYLQFISLHSLRELFLFALFFMQIKHVSHHLELQKDIQLLPVLLIYQLRHATPLGLEVVGLWAGFLL
jgi:hypothetical protein